MKKQFIFWIAVSKSMVTHNIILTAHLDSSQRL